MVRGKDAKMVFQRAFTRPPRLLFTNPVAFMFSLYYGYIYSEYLDGILAFPTHDEIPGIVFVFVIAIPLLYGSPPWSHESLPSYGWPHATIPLGYLGLGLGFLSASAVATYSQDRIYRFLSYKNGDKGQPEYRVSWIL